MQLMSTMSKFTAETDLINSVVTDTPSWSSQTLKAWDENSFREREPFVSEKYWSGQQSINVFDVVGTAHPDYQGLSWLEFLAQGKRMRQNLLLQEQNPGYYLVEDIKQPTMFYIEIDGGGWYVNGDGNHRTCIAKFMFHGMGRTMLHGVTVESYRTDMKALAAFQRLREAALKNRLPIIVSPHRKTLTRDDTAGWMREHYEVRIRVEDLDTGKDELLSPAQADVYAGKIIASQNSGGMLAKLFSKLLGGK